LEAGVGDSKFNGLAGIFQRRSKDIPGLRPVPQGYLWDYERDPFASLRHMAGTFIQVTHMLNEQLDALKIPKNLRTPIERLLRSLEEANTPEEVAAEAEIQLEFVRGLESDRRIRKPDIEALYIFFDDAVQARLEGLQG